MWIDKNKDIFLLRNLPFQQAIDHNFEAYSHAVFGVIESSFSHIDVFKENSFDLDILYVYPFDQNQRFVFDQEQFDVAVGDCLISLNKIEKLDYLKTIKFYYSREKAKIGDGSKNFEVECLVRDVYKLSVFAETEEEAVELARLVPASKWEHLVIDNHLEETAMIRISRWGNMSARIKQ
jgi:hypothetical protein